MAHRLDSIELFSQLGLNCFVFDYRGYGRSQGKPTEQGTYSDATAAYRWLTEVQKIPPMNIIIFGRSLGGSIAAHLASKVGARALVIESAFTSYADIGQELHPYIPVRLFAMFRYATIDYIRDLNCPIMIIHGRNDQYIPFEFGRRLYQAAKEPKQFVELAGGHNDAFILSDRQYRKAWTDWLRFLDEYEHNPDRSNVLPVT